MVFRNLVDFMWKGLPTALHKTEEFFLKYLIYKFCRWISHEIRMKSGRFHVKSAWNPLDFTWNLPDFKNVSFWVITKYRSFFRKTKHCEITTSAVKVIWAHQWFKVQINLIGFRFEPPLCNQQNVCTLVCMTLLALEINLPIQRSHDTSYRQMGYKHLLGKITWTVEHWDLLGESTSVLPPLRSSSSLPSRGPIVAWRLAFSVTPTALIRPGEKKTMFNIEPVPIFLQYFR